MPSAPPDVEPWLRRLGHWLHGLYFQRATSYHVQWDSLDGEREEQEDSVGAGAVEVQERRQMRAAVARVAEDHEEGREAAHPVEAVPLHVVARGALKVETVEPTAEVA